MSDDFSRQIYEKKKKKKKREAPAEKISFKEFVFSLEQGYVTQQYINFMKAPMGLFPCVDYIGRAENLKMTL